MNATGTLAWSVRTGGTLAPRDHLRLTGQLMLTRLARLPGRLRRALGLRDERLGRIDADALRLPDTADARRTMEHAALLTPGWVYQHSLRTYAWGALLAQARGVAHDEELLFIAAALHDLGLARQPRTCDAWGCFAVHGAREAGRFVRQLGWDEERRDRLEEAITLHLNVRVGLDAGAEAHLLHAGAALDCIGAGLAEIPPAAVTQIVERYPRQDFKARVAEALTQQAAVHFASRTAFLLRLGFIAMVQAAPFGE